MYFIKTPRSNSKYPISVHRSFHVTRNLSNGHGELNASYNYLPRLVIIRKISPCGGGGSIANNGRVTFYGFQLARATGIRHTDIGKFRPNRSRRTIKGDNAKEMPANNPVVMVYSIPIYKTSWNDEIELIKWEYLSILILVVCLGGTRAFENSIPINVVIGRAFSKYTDFNVEKPKVSAIRKRIPNLKLMVYLGGS